jgi:hypothetical protein
MRYVSAHYSFRQRFRCSSNQAFRWCTDYRADDHAIENIVGTRKIRWLSDDLVLLTDARVSSDGRTSTKRKLIRILASDLTWTATILDGPTRYSQFWYKIVPVGRTSSFLEFTGLYIERESGTSSPGSVSKLARELTREQKHRWRVFAERMKQDLG